ncbi:MAG: hypothetical protein JJ863_24565 [Deltaproteobacteria bacterium]|nr:hypothetical protein [Deltaproteobacteria bacterium]
MKSLANTPALGPHGPCWAREHAEGRPPDSDSDAARVESREHRRLRRRGRVKKGGYCHLAGDHYLVTCRVLLRRYLFKPDRAITGAFKYLLGEYARRHGVRIFAVCVMSTHYHLVVLDTRGVLPNFLRDVNWSVANVVKARYRTSGAVFEQELSKVKLHGAKAVVDKIAYMLANPVAAAAVRDPREWPGLRTRLADMGRTVIRGTRPEHYSGRRKTMAPDASFAVEMPPVVLEEYGVDGAKKALADALEARVAEARAEVRRKGWTYLGAKRAASVSPFKQAVAFEVYGARNPDLSTYGSSSEEASTVKREYIAFHRAYQHCRERMLRGETDLRWPPGTWAMVQHFGQRASPLSTVA